MSKETPSETSLPPVSTVTSTPEQATFNVAAIRSQQNIGLATAAGIGAALVGAFLWAAVTYTTHYELGLMAIAVGVIVGKAIRKVGQGIDPVFGYVGAACALGGSILGTLLSDIGTVARHQDVPFTQIIARLNPSFIETLYTTMFQPMDILFYGIAVYEAYKFSFKYRLVRKAKT